jgi:hypothetical protein
MIYLNGNWNYIGPPGFSNALSSNCAITSYQNIPYIIYRDGAVANKSTVRYYNSPVSVDELVNTISTLNIYPNPVKEILNSDIECFNCKIQISNIFGQILSESNAFPIDTKAFSNGLYFIKIENQNDVIYQKFIIQE